MRRILRLDMRTAAVALALLVVTATVYRPVARNGFINYDDNAYVTLNPTVLAGLTWRGAAWAFTNTEVSNWHPLTWLSHMLDVELFGPNPEGHHLMSLVFHAVNAILLLAVLRRMTGRLWTSALVAALFAVHPLHVESVAWTAERKDVVSTFFWLLTMMTYQRYAWRPGAWKYLAVLAMFAAGLMSKSMLVTVPFVLLLLDWWPLGRLRIGKQGGKEGGRPAAFLVLEKMPLFLFSAASGAATYLIQKHAGAMASSDYAPFPVRAANALVAYVNYLWKTVWPADLSILYPFTVTVSPWLAAVAGLSLAGTAAAVVSVGKKRPYLAFGWFWYLGTLVPVIGLVQVGSQAMADRYTYMTLTGIFVASAWGLADLGRGRPGARAIFSVAALALVAALGILTSVQVGWWKDDITLYRHALDTGSDHYMLRNNLGLALSDRGRYGEAVEQYRIALRLNPGAVKVYNNMGLAMGQQGRSREAIFYFYEAISRKPDFSEAHNNLGIALEEAGKREEAEKHYREAIRLNPRSAEAHLNLGLLLAAGGKPAEAAGSFRAALAVNPGMSQARNNLGNALLALGKPWESVEQYREAIRINPRYADAYYNLGLVLERMGRGEEAAARYRDALRINPGMSLAHNNLGLILERQGRTEEAVVHFETAARLQPGRASTRFNPEPPRDARAR